MAFTFNYAKISQGLLKRVDERARNILERRFGLPSKGAGDGRKKETLEAIGKSYGITRERVRQIEQYALVKLRSKIKQYQKVFQYFHDVIQGFGDLKKEETLLEFLAPQKFSGHVLFLLTLGHGFERKAETENLHSLWTINPNSLDLAKELIATLSKELEKKGSPLPAEELFSLYKGTEITERKSINREVFLSYLEISKKIKTNPEGLFGLKDWPEITPRGVKDKAYIILKRENQPLHFKKITFLINQLSNGRRAQERSVHNELIKDPRFILVGRGVYALRGWGYSPSPVKEVIVEILKEAARPLSKEEILERVLKRKLVKKNTVLFNLNNKCFVRDRQGRYWIA